jgi:hypothetical protein
VRGSIDVASYCVAGLGVAATDQAHARDCSVLIGSRGSTYERPRYELGRLSFCGTATNLPSRSRLFALRRLGRRAKLVAKRARCHVTRPPKCSPAAFLGWFGYVTRRPTGCRNVGGCEANRRSEYECNHSTHFRILFEKVTATLLLTSLDVARK